LPGGPGVLEILAMLEKLQKFVQGFAHSIGIGKNSTEKTAGLRQDLDCTRFFWLC